MVLQQQRATMHQRDTRQELGDLAGRGAAAFREPDQPVLCLQGGIERPGAKAVPVYFSGTFEAWPHSHALPRPHKVTIRFGAPISADELEKRGDGPNGPARIASALENEVAKLRRHHES